VAGFGGMLSAGPAVPARWLWRSGIYAACRR